MQKVNSSMISKYTGAVQPKKVRLSPMARIWLLLGVSLLAIVLFMTINLNGNISYILTHRAYIILTMIIVAFAAGVSTILFQTIANNRILTPSLMGLEALFVLLQTLFIFFEGYARLLDGQSDEVLFRVGLISVIFGGSISLAI